MGSQVAHCAPVEEAIDGLSISLRTTTVLQHWECDCHTRQDPVPVLPLGELCTQLCRFTQGEKVVEMLLTHLFRSRLGRGGRRMREGGRLPPSQLKPQMSWRGQHIIAMETPQ